MRLNNKQSVRLLPIGRNLCEKLVRSDSGRSREIQLVLNLLPDDLRHARCGR